MRRRMLGTLLACGLAVGLVGSTTLHGQDLQTQLALFLNDLFAGTLGVTKPVTSLQLTSGANVSTLTGTGAGSVSLAGTTPAIQFGGTTSSFPELLRNGTRLGVKLADGSAYAPLDAGTVTSNAGGFAFNGGSDAFFLAGGTTKLFIITAPSAPSSCGTSPAVTASNGSAVFVVTGGTGGTATGCTITMPTASTGWNCNVVNITQTAAHRADRDTRQTASTTTSVTWEYVVVSTGAATAFTASDVFRGSCWAY